MREIKFRAWDGKEMWTGFHILPSNIIAPPAYTKTKTDLEFMQFTGLKDKNGVEIWEGDIVRPVIHADSNSASVVVYADSKATFCAPQVIPHNRYELPEKHWMPLHSLIETYGSGIEVIGNTYENPKLLKETV